VTRATGGSFAARRGFLEALPLALPGASTAFFCAWRGTQLAGAVPLVETRRWGHRWIYSLPFGTYGGPLLDPDEADPARVKGELAKALGAWLAAGKIAGGEIVCAPDGSESADPAWTSLAGEAMPGTAHVLVLEGRTFDEYTASLRHETRKDLRHAGRDDVRVSEDPGALPGAYALYRRQAESWHGHRPYPLPFLQTLLAHPTRFARLFAARRGGELLAAILALGCGDEVFLWWSGSSPESRRYLAYPFLIVEIVRAAYAGGARRVNIGSSGGLAALERFKSSLGAEPRTYWSYRLAPHAAGPGLRLLEWARARYRGR
jgi:hypothetical protein